MKPNQLLLGLSFLMKRWLNAQGVQGMSDRDNAHVLFGTAMDKGPAFNCGLVTSDRKG